MQPSFIINCSVVDRGTGTPAIGMGVILKRITPTPDTFLGRIDTTGGVKNWLGMKPNPSSRCLDRKLSLSNHQITKWTIEFMTTTFFDPVKPAYDSATGRVHLNFAVQPAEQVHVVLLVDIYGFSTHIQATRIGAVEGSESRPYTRLSSSQNKALADHFIDEPYPSRSSYLQLSQRLDIARDQTVKWFQRARARNRQALPMRPKPVTTGATHPLRKQTSSSDLRSPYLLRSRNKGENRTQVHLIPSTGVNSGDSAEGGRSDIGEANTIIVEHPGLVGMVLIEENCQIVRSSARKGISSGKTLHTSV